MLTPSQSFGKKCEIFARHYLEEHGYRILDINYRTPFGEIDIIAKENNMLAFIEVKARRSRKYGGPKYAVNFKKQQKMIQSSLFYLQQTKQSQVSFRFDVVAILEHYGSCQIEVIKNAFQSQGVI